MPTHEHRLRAGRRARRWLWLASGACACVGTPTPEPPDYAPELLPTPDGVRIFSTAEVVSLGQPAATPLRGPAGSVAPNSQVWIINLDDADVQPVETTATASGAFSTNVSGTEGNRLRIVSRSDTQHSLPLDARFVRSANMVTVATLPPEGLACLRIMPSQELTEPVKPGSDVQRAFVLDNRCNDAVVVERATLRFGDQGFVLATPPSSVPVNQSERLELRIQGHADAREHADVLLLDVLSAGTRGRYALGVWSVSSSGTGND